MLEKDTIWHTVLTEAQAAYDDGEVPVGAVIVHDNTILASAHNLTETIGQATAHAELVVLQTASEILGTKSLHECDLYVSLEPCTMCAGAIAHSRIKRLYFGAYDVKGGAVEHGVQFFRSPTCHHKPEIYGGLHAEQCSALLQSFFSDKR